MQLTITVLGKKSTRFISEILTTISSCHCDILELRSSHLEQVIACYLLVNGDWNHIAKLESILVGLQKTLEVRIHTLRPEPSNKEPESIPYSLETISLDRNNVIEDITSFLFERRICIHEINASSYQASYVKTPIFSTRIIILIPPEIRLLSLREEFLDFCDSLNIDAIIEPIKH
ncbi:MAG: transcriptional regulator [Methylococcales bacterium]|nr:transcriptional regulator [Methylococcales bacterium]